LTSTFNDEFNEDAVVDEAATLVEGLLGTYLYSVVNEAMPESTTDVIEVLIKVRVSCSVDGIARFSLADLSQICGRPDQ